MLVGDTTTEPLMATLPIPGEMVTFVAFTVANMRVADSPCMMFIGVAVHVRIWGCGFITVTVAVALSWLVSFLAVSTYVVVAVGDTESVPLDGFTVPIPVIETEVAFNTR